MTRPAERHGHGVDGSREDGAANRVRAPQMPLLQADGERPVDLLAECGKTPRCTLAEECVEAVELEIPMLHYAGGQERCRDGVGETQLAKVRVVEHEAPGHDRGDP